MILAVMALRYLQPVMAQSTVLFTSGNGTVEFRSEAPLELIEAESKELKGVLDVTKRNFSFAVANRSFKGFNSPLQQEHFYENYIEAGKYPVSTFKGKIIEQVDLSADGTYLVRAKGMLSVHGVEQERIIKVDIRVKNGIIQASSSFTIHLSDHNITIPKIVYRKIAEEIEVSVGLTLLPEKK